MTRVRETARTRRLRRGACPERSRRARLRPFAIPRGTWAATVPDRTEVALLMALVSQRGLLLPARKKVRYC